MFSGLVEALGSIKSIEERDAGYQLVIETPFADFELGESIAVSGCCLTVAAFAGGAFTTDVSAETVRKTTLGTLAVGAVVNLERSLRVGDRIGGHFVTGHVDGVGHVLDVTAEGDSALFTFRAPEEIARLLVEKGSVTVNGVSLTTFGCEGLCFTVAVIPHTQEVTNLGRLGAGHAVNLEADLLAKHVEKLIAPRVGAE